MYEKLTCNKRGSLGIRNLYELEKKLYPHAKSTLKKMVSCPSSSPSSKLFLNNSCFYKPYN